MKEPEIVYVFCDPMGNPDKVDRYPYGKYGTKYIRADKALTLATIEPEIKDAWLRLRQNCYDVNEVFEGLMSKLRAL